MQLRPYQSAALAAISDDMNVPGASIVVLPTGSGKSFIIAAAALLKRPVLILVPSRELLAQDMEKLSLIVPMSDIGVYSASYGRREIKTFTLATIQSVYKKPELFRDVQLVIVDENHLINPKQMATMYQKFFTAIGNPKILGLTATPYRMSTVYEKVGDELYAATGVKMVNRVRIKDTSKSFWSRIIVNVTHAELLAEGYLAPLEYIHEPLLPYESLPVNASQSDFDLSKYSQSIVGFEANILRTIAEAQKRYKSVLVFCADTGQATRLSEIVVGSGLVLGSTKKKDRLETIERFKSGRIKTVFNVGVLTVGFDHPALDCIVNIRPVRSPILYLQMLGRLTRPAEGKTHGTVIDLTGSCKALGRIETFEVFKNGWAWDVRSEKVPGFHDRILFRIRIDTTI
jgi:DNA repair protein RadD